MYISKLTEFDYWLDSILRKKLPGSTVAVNFNLYDNVDDEWAAELVATDEFDEEDEDWACSEVFTTRGNPFCIKYNGTWEEIQKIFEEKITNYLENGKFAHKLKQYQAVGIGFVDGNISLLYKKE
ncbi:MAG: hypothetical protein GX166_04485 [Clostridiaceae bacterium]|nr:hypothetical protein [Clostridiaceae bacterium]